MANLLTVLNTFENGLTRSILNYIVSDEYITDSKILVALGIVTKEEHNRYLFNHLIKIQTNVLRIITIYNDTGTGYSEDSDDTDKTNIEDNKIKTQNLIYDNNIDYELVVNIVSTFVNPNNNIVYNFDKNRCKYCWDIAAKNNCKTGICESYGVYYDDLDISNRYSRVAEAILYYRDIYTDIIYDIVKYIVKHISDVIIYAEYRDGYVLRKLTMLKEHKLSRIIFMRSRWSGYGLTP